MEITVEFVCGCYEVKKGDVVYARCFTSGEAWKIADSLSDEAHDDMERFRRIGRAFADG